MGVKTSIIVVEECGLSRKPRVPPNKPYGSSCITYARERQDKYNVNKLTQRKESSKKRRHKTIHGKLVCKNFNQKKLRINLRAPFYEKQKPMMDLKPLAKQMEEEEH